jgi:DNA-binding transcriptional MocR family regulator
MDCKYQNIADSVREKIFSGEYKPGAKLPSIQAFSRETGYNPDTIIKAYSLLETDHLIFSVPKSGFYVVKSLAAKSRNNAPADMRRICPPDGINPYKDFCHCMDKAVKLYGDKLFDYAQPKGMPELIDALVGHLMNDNIFTRPKNLYVTNGAQQALYILGNMPFPNNRTKVLVEQPTYSVMLQALKNANTPVVGIKRDHDGIDLDALEALFKQGDIKLFYTMPRFHNPLGCSCDLKEKRRIAELAVKHGVYILEDDYLADLETDRRADSIYGLGDKEWIIYVRSFSKTLLPGLRLGMCILPDKLQSVFESTKRSLDIHTPVLTQGALEIYLKSKMVKAHMHKIRSHYIRKMALIRQALKLPASDQIVWHVPPTGLFVSIELRHIPAKALANRLSSLGILVSTTDDCYIEGFPHHEGLRLSVCSIDESEINRVIELIDREARAFL